MWIKAAELLHSHQVLLALGCPPQYCMVASKSTQKPHFVSMSKDGRFECDDLCPSLAQRYMCEHVVAAAENNGMLKEFIESYGKFAKTSKGQKSISPNFTRLSMVNLPKNTAGRKGNKPPAKRPISCRKTVPDEERLPMLT